MRIRMLALALGLILSGGAQAETLKAVPATLDPAKAYVLIEYRLMPNALASLPGSTKYMPFASGLVFARYDPALGDIRGLGRAKANPVPGGKVVEPFQKREIARTDDARLVLLEVEPDTWVVQGYGDTTFALGSNRFTLLPGTVTDLGVVQGARDWAEGDRAMNGGDLAKMVFLGPFAKRPPLAPMRVSFRARTAGDMPVPAALAGVIRPVTFTPDARFGNVGRGLVNRIEGVNLRLKSAPATQ